MICLTLSIRISNYSPNLIKQSDESLGWGKSVGVLNVDMESCHARIQNYLLLSTASRKDTVNLWDPVKALLLTNESFEIVTFYIKLWFNQDRCRKALHLRLIEGMNFSNWWLKKSLLQTKMVLSSSFFAYLKSRNVMSWF